MKPVRVTILLAVLLPLLLTACGGTSTDLPAAGGAALPAPGRTAPEISLFSLEGEAMTLSGFRGRPVLINFWASWCGPCRDEMPYLQAVNDSQAFRDAGFKLLEVNIQEDVPTVRGFLATYDLDFTVLMDVDAAAARAYNVNGIPASFFVDRNGIIQKVKIGAYASLDVLERDVRSLIESR